ncbi:hypothetical protein [Leifsonia poae]|nr:hypothetical protein [Leifsonia poae]
MQRQGSDPVELGDEIVVECADYVAGIAEARRRIPAGFIINAILVD